jgi:hypothetical protein
MPSVKPSGSNDLLWLHTKYDPWGIGSITSKNDGNSRVVTYND